MYSHSQGKIPKLNNNVEYLSSPSLIVVFLYSCQAFLNNCYWFYSNTIVYMYLNYYHRYYILRSLIIIIYYVAQHAFVGIVFTCGCTVNYVVHVICVMWYVCVIDWMLNWVLSICLRVYICNNSTVGKIWISQRLWYNSAIDSYQYIQ